jgi:Fe-S-cluster containining protein
MAQRTYDKSRNGLQEPGGGKRNGNGRSNGNGKRDGNGGKSSSPPRPPARVPVPCLQCGLCCKYVAIEIERPSTLKRATEILWYLYHEGISVYRDGDEWTVQFETRCRQQDDDNRCRIYESRPHICRDLVARTCEVNSLNEGEYYRTPEQFLDYLKKRRKKLHQALLQGGFAPDRSAAPEAAPTKRKPGSFFEHFRQVRSTGISLQSG